MSALTHDLLIQGIAAAKTGAKSDATRYFSRLLGLDPTLDEQVEAWQWLVDLDDDSQNKRKYLDEILARNPGDPRARQKLALLNGQISSAELIDPDKPGIGSSSQPVRSPFQRSTCSNCGGRMVYSADQTEMVCENCGTKRPIRGILSRTSAAQNNFTAAMVTARGHTAPSRVKVTTCHGCGADFLIPSQSLSSDCPYCGSSYAAGQLVEKEIILPASLIPFKIGFKDIRTILQKWYRDQGVKTVPTFTIPIGFYFPVWSFSVGGQLSWVCSLEKNDRWETVRDSKVMLQSDLLISATRHLPEISNELLPTYDLTGMVGYNPHYLANWPAETYQITMSDASLTARNMILDAEKERIPAQYDGRITNLRIDSTSLTFDTFTLSLLPIWLSTYRSTKSSFDIVVNGQNGIVVGERPAAGLSEWINDIFGK